MLSSHNWADVKRALARGNAWLGVEGLQELKGQRVYFVAHPPRRLEKGLFQMYLGRFSAAHGHRAVPDGAEVRRDWCARPAGEG